MYHKLFSLILSLNFISMFSQGNNVYVEQVYKNLVPHDLEYFQIPDEFPLTEGYQTTEKEESHFVLLDIYNPVQLKIKKFTYDNPASNFYWRDSIFLFKNKFCIDNLFYDKKILKTQQPLSLNYASGYTFSLNLKKYLALYFWDSTIPTSNMSYFIILFDISDKRNIKYYFFDEQMSFNPNCFGDFNNDGKIDFINWVNGSNILCYTLVKNKFRKMKNKFIKVTENVNNEFSINWKKSQWF